MMDWMRLATSGNNLRGVVGPMRKVTMRELRKHCTEEDAWMALRGYVYNITPYLKFHPGGVSELMRGAGADGTYLFDEVHKWVNIENMMKPCIVGTLEAPKPKASTLATASLGAKQSATGKTFAGCEVVGMTRHNHDSVLFDLELSASVALGPGQHIRLRGKGEYGRVVIRDYTPIAPVSTAPTNRITLLVKLYPEGFMSQILLALATDTDTTTATTATAADYSNNDSPSTAPSTSTTSTAFTITTTAPLSMPPPASRAMAVVCTPPGSDKSVKAAKAPAAKAMSCSQPCGTDFSYAALVKVRAHDPPNTPQAHMRTRTHVHRGSFCANLVCRKSPC